ncbi:hypothetical protein MUK42_07306 [Musa troglodytarum]|uniref:Acyl carrier protein n=1 Tax=Musa troglodytarum TaxID=320322 RepID=A0A9E7HYL6_9LILI|nr:hypothetical protein MUK42_07306 [Musa troglodytarum]
MAAMRGALLRHLRVRVDSQAAPAAAFSFADLVRRRFSDEAMGSFLDKSDVADRIITVVKNFPKVDPSKPLSDLVVIFCSEMASLSPSIRFEWRFSATKALVLLSLSSFRTVSGL